MALCSYVTKRFVLRTWSASTQYRETTKHYKFTPNVSDGSDGEWLSKPIIYRGVVAKTNRRPIIREAVTCTTGNCENLISCFSINFYVSRAQRVFSASGHTGECKDPSYLWLNNSMTLELYRRYKSPNILDQFYALGTPLYPVTRRNAEGVILFFFIPQRYVYRAV